MFTGDCHLLLYYPILESGVSSVNTHQIVNGSSSSSECHAHIVGCGGRSNT